MNLQTVPPYVGSQRVSTEASSILTRASVVFWEKGQIHGKIRIIFASKKGIEQGKRYDLVGGGLIRSAGGWSAIKALRRIGAYQKGDERIL